MPLPQPEANLIDLSTPTPGSAGSLDNDFGAFVSSPDPTLAMPAAQPSATAAASFDPLAALDSDPLALASLSTAQPTSSEFFSEATQRTMQKRADVLGELLAHEDDPLYWVERSKDDPTTDALTEGLHTPMFENPPPPPALPRVPSTAALPAPPKPDTSVQVQAPMPRPASKKTRRADRSDLLLDLDDDVKLPEEGPPSAPPTPTNGHPVPLSPPQPQPQRPTASPLQSSSRSPSRSRSQSTTPTQTVLSRTGTLGRKWMSSLLSSASSPTASSSLPATDEVTPQFSPRRTDSLALLSSAVKHPHSPGPAPSGPVASSSLSHGTPFSRGAYVPPSGAPAFKGDRAWNKGFEFSAAEQTGAPVALVGRTAATAPVLSAAIASRLRAFLPPLARLEATWTLLYSLDQHGISLSTLYKRCANPADEDTPRLALLVVRDADDGVFGAFVPDGVVMHRRYYGSGESFLWRTTRAPGTDEDGVQVYRWTGKNTYVALCEPAFISFGGGDGHYGLWIDSTLFDGSSARCPTFDNDVLSGPPRPYEHHEPPIRRDDVDLLGFSDQNHQPQERAATVTDKFECVGLEVWWIGAA